MPINNVHQEYKDMLPSWVACRDVFAGERAVKAAGTKYLPRLSAQKEADYQNYKLRATFFNITAKTLNALTGLVMSKPVITQYDELLKAYFEDRDGVQLGELVGLSVQEVLLMGRFGLLVDAPVGGGQPIILTYSAESIINWSTTADGKLEWVVLKELVQQPLTSDRFVLESVVQYRLLELVDGVYTVQLYDDQNKPVGPQVTPQVNGQPLSEIPFIIMNPSGTDAGIEKSPMEDIVNMNLSLYRTSADLEWGRHFTGLPTPVISGVDSSTTLTIGGTQAWVLPDPNAKAYFLEFTGQGLQSLEKAMSEKQGQLATMSARMIDQSTRGSESAEAVRLRYLSESSTLSQVCSTIDKALNLVYGWVATFIGVDKPSISMPKEFLASRLTPAELNALTTTYLKGLIDKATYIYNLRRGDMLDPQRTDDEVINAIVTEAGADVVEKVDPTDSVDNPTDTKNVTEGEDNGA